MPSCTCLSRIVDFLDVIRDWEVTFEKELSYSSVEQGTAVISVTVPAVKIWLEFQFPKHEYLKELR